MSKKLLMNNYSVDGLMPITDGLVCWLDGRDIVNGEDVWKDRSGNGNDFEIYNPSFSNIINTAYFSKNLSTYAKSKNIFQLMVNSEKTIEVKYQFNNYHIWGRVFSFSNVYAIQTDSYTMNKINTGQTWVNVDINGGYNMITITSNLEKNTVYNNANLLFTNVANTLTTNLGYLYLNRESASIQTPIDLYIASLKIYNRALTEEEIRHNYLYEQSIKRGD